MKLEEVTLGTSYFNKRLGVKCDPVAVCQDDGACLILQLWEEDASDITGTVVMGEASDLEPWVEPDPKALLGLSNLLGLARHHGALAVNGVVLELKKLHQETANTLREVARFMVFQQEPLIPGNVLPLLGTRVYILHGRDDDAHPCMVTGYYATGSKESPRVNVMVAYEGGTATNSRSLHECFATKEEALAHRKVNPR